MDKERTENAVLTALLIILSIGIGILYFDTSYERIWEGIKDIWSSLQYFFITLFRIDKEIEPSVLKPSIAHESILRIPGGMNGFFSMVGDYFNLLFTKDNFTKWIDVVGGISLNIFFFFIIFIPSIIVFTLVIKLTYSFSNTDHNKDTIPLKIYKKSVGVCVIKIKRIILRCIQLVRENTYLKYTLVLTWLLNFNILILLLEFVAYYFYFVLSYDLSTLGGQFYKLLVDLRAIIVFVPMWLLFVLSYLYLYKLRKRIAKSKLKHMEALNKCLIRTLPVATIGSALVSHAHSAITELLPLKTAYCICRRQRAPFLPKLSHTPIFNFKRCVSSATGGAKGVFPQTEPHPEILTQVIV